MQDVAWAYEPEARMGYVLYPPVFGYFPCKNDLATAASLSARGVPPYAAATSEMAVYNAHAAMLRAAGCSVPQPVDRSFHGVVCPLGAAVVLHPSFAPCTSVLRARLPTPKEIVISGRSTLLVKGRHITIEALDLDGALELSCCEGASLRIVSLTVRNDGWLFDELAPAVQASPSCPEVLRMRGYTLRKRGSRRIAVTSPGAYVVVDGVLQQLPPRASGPSGVAIDSNVPPSADACAAGSLTAPGAPGATTAGGGASTAVGGPLLGALPPPQRAVWSTRKLEVAPRCTVCLPLVLPEPSVAVVDIRPSTSGLVLSLMGDATEGRGPVLPPAYLAAVAADGGNGGAVACPLELDVPGSGVFSMEIRNTNFFTPVAFSARVAHEPAAEREAATLRLELRARQDELSRVAQQEEELTASEAELARRLWEVQETRRRHAAIKEQLAVAVHSVEAALRSQAAPPPPS
jgi:hypothetical protein